MGSKKNVSVDGAADHVKIIGEIDPSKLAPDVDETKPAEAEETAQTTKKVKTGRSAKYREVKAMVDRSKLYPASEAFELVKRTSYSKFAGTISADLVLKDTNNQISVTFPHTTGKQLRVGIVDDGLLADVEAGKIDFDILLTTPQYMPKLARLARILGPKGLMPNPKNNTIVSDPEKAKAELLGGKTVLKTERKAPLLHVALGKTNTPTNDLVDNLQALIKALDGKALKCTVSSTMSPGVKVQLSSEI